MCHWKKITYRKERLGSTEGWAQNMVAFDYNMTWTWVNRSKADDRSLERITKYANENAE
jgi:hypothetical protein